MSREPSDCYDAPGYWDLSFSDETPFEADFLQDVIAKYLPVASPKILEIGCGGGRQVVEQSRRGYRVTAFDLNQSCVDWTLRQLRRRQLSGNVLRGDMASFQLEETFDLAHCLVNTFRHLVTEDDARRHLECVADSLNPGGVYVLGFHLLPPDAAEDDCERWSITRRGTRVTTTVRVLSFDRRKRLEVVRFSLKVTTSKKIVRLSTDHKLRIYRADQFRRLLNSVPSFHLRDVYDFCYDIADPLPLDNRLGDAVFVLQKQ